MTAWQRLFALLVSCVGAIGCHAAEPAPRLPDPSSLHCPPGTAFGEGKDFDGPWGEVFSYAQCYDGATRTQGVAIEEVDFGMQPPGRLVGSYRDGVRVGTWRLFEPKSGAVLSTFTFDDDGTGVEIIRDLAGRSRMGRVVRGKREGAWTYRDRDGRIVQTDLYEHDTMLRQVGDSGWTPPMLDPRDVCPDVPDASAYTEDEDGCPVPSPR